MAKAPVKIERNKDGRHHVIDGDGQILGKHNSVWSAARQVHDLGTPMGGEGTADQGGMHPSVPRPEIPRPKQSTAPNEKPKPIPRP